MDLRALSMRQFIRTSTEALLCQQILSPASRSCQHLLPQYSASLLCRRICVQHQQQRHLASSAWPKTPPRHKGDKGQTHPLKGYYRLHERFPIRPAKQRRDPSGAEANADNIYRQPEAAQSQSFASMSPEQKMGIVFGTRLAGPGYTSSRYRPTMREEGAQVINGVNVPPRPLEPDNCCMSGCVNCVWDNYRDDLEDWARTLKEAKAKGGQTSLQGTENVRAEDAEIYAGIPVEIAEFMKTEKRLKEKRLERQSKEASPG